MPLEEKVEQILPLLRRANMAAGFRYRCVEHPTGIDDVHIADAVMQQH